MMLMMIVCILVTAGLAVAAVVMAGRSGPDEKVVAERVSQLGATVYVPEDAGKLLRKKKLEGSFNERVLFPLAQQIFDKTQAFIPIGSKSFVRTKLQQAGYTKPHLPKVFLGIQLLTASLMFGFLFMVTTFIGSVPWLVGVMTALAFGVMGYVLPMGWLMQEAGKRQLSIQKSLADFLDLLIICMESGLGLDMAISKVANLNLNKSSTYLREELIRYNKDVAFGKPRKEAMLDMATRTGVEDFNTIINALVQAYEMGSSVAHTLRIQADSLRVKRLQQAEEKANKIPVKMVLPIYLFLFPAIFVTIMGPIIMVVAESMMGIAENMQGLN